MTITGMAALAPILNYLPPQFDQKWDDGVYSFYLRALGQIPDSDVPRLAQLIPETCEKRPAPAKILELWRTIRTETPPAVPQHKRFEINYDLSEEQMQANRMGAATLKDVLTRLNPEIAKNRMVRTPTPAQRPDPPVVRPEHVQQARRELHDAGFENAPPEHIAARARNIASRQSKSPREP